MTRTTKALTDTIAITDEHATGVLVWSECEDERGYVNGGVALVDGDTLILTDSGSHRHTYGDEDYEEEDAVFRNAAELEPWTDTPYWQWADDHFGCDPVIRYSGSGDPVEI